MKKLIFLPLFFCAFLGFSQEEILLKGQLVFLSMNTSPINISNVTKNTGTTNNADGEFQIKVTLGDELLFSSIQFEPYRVIMTKEIMEDRWIRVELTPLVNELAEVNISNRKLTGNMKTDMAAVDLKNYYNNASFGMPMPAPQLTVEERRLYTASSGGPIGLLINVISGRLKKLKKLKELSELTLLIEKASESLDEDFFVLECDVPKAYIASFMYFCAADPYFETLIGQDQKLTLAEFFLKKAKGFREKRGWEENGKE